MLFYSKMYSKYISSSSSPSNTAYFFLSFFLAYNSISNPSPHDLSKERKTRILIFPKKPLKFSHLFAEPPVFTSTPPTSIAVQNRRGTIRLSCSAKGSPLPKITWYKDSVIMNSTTTITGDEVTSKIEVSQFGLLGHEKYTCVAHNEYNDKINKTARVGE